MSHIPSLIRFVIEIEKLKNVLRKSRPVGLGRYENSAEHSWHVCVIALLFSRYANEKIDIDRVVKMLLIHDLVEIDAGDVLAYHANTDAVRKSESEAAERIFALLPEAIGQELKSLWLEFEAAATPEALYAKAMDRVPAVVQNLHGQGHTWRKHHISEEAILALNAKIGAGCEPLWVFLRDELEQAFRHGLLKEDDGADDSP